MYYLQPPKRAGEQSDIHINQNAPALLMYMLTIPDPMVRRRVKKRRYLLWHSRKRLKKSLNRKTFL